MDAIVIEGPGEINRRVNPARFLTALERALPRALTPSAQKLRSRAPRGKTRQLGSRGFDVRAKRINEGLIQGVQGEIGARVRYGHLVAGGHKIVPRGPTRRKVSITTVRISRRTGRQVVSVREGFDPTTREQLRERRARGATGFVPGHTFEDRVMNEDRAQIVRLVEKLVAQDLLR